ncbi:MAG: aspartate 1-decarboxylase [Phototrophicales bacterium]|nr:MAG: aspartate 1-decarboxylase [Phototrophicales bacterium]
MLLTLLKAKLHQARVTGADLEYVGSISIDADLLDAANIYPYEKVLVVDIENGNRLETYVLEGERGSGIMQLNGAAAHLVNVGDRIIVMAFAHVEAPPPSEWEPKVLILDEHNRIISSN